MNGLRSMLSRIKSRVYMVLEDLCVSNQLLIRLYFFLFNRSFDDEMTSTLRGKVAFRWSNENVARLRRNIHRLEKGLIMRPRKEVFGLAYIEDTVRDFCAIWRRSGPATGGSEFASDLDWAGSVLDRYFRESGTHHIVKRAFTRYQAVVPSPATWSGKSPQQRGELQQSPVDYDGLLALSLQRRSVRWFAPKAVPLDLVDRALLVARQAPSACNRQPYRYILVRERSRINSIASIPGGAADFAHQIPLLIVAVGDLGCYAAERDRHLIYVDTSLATMGLLLALETVGLSSCVINWPDLRRANRSGARNLGLRDDERIIFLVGVGYADAAGLVPWSEKRSLPQIRSIL